MPAYTANPIPKVLADGAPSLLDSEFIQVLNETDPFQRRIVSIFATNQVNTDEITNLEEEINSQSLKIDELEDSVNNLDEEIIDLKEVAEEFATLEVEHSDQAERLDEQTFEINELKDDGALERMSLNGIEYARTHFTSDAVRDQILGIVG